MGTQTFTSCSLLVLSAFLFGLDSGAAFAEPRQGVHSGIIYSYDAVNRKDNLKIEGGFRIDGDGIFQLHKNKDGEWRRTRVGDVERPRKGTVKLIFTDHDKLNGIATLEHDSKEIWTGSYLDSARQNWAFSMRKVLDSRPKRGN